MSTWSSNQKVNWGGKANEHDNDSDGHDHAGSQTDSTAKNELYTCQWRGLASVNDDGLIHEERCTKLVQGNNPLVSGSTSCAQHACATSSCPRPFWSAVSRRCEMHQCRWDLGASAGMGPGTGMASTHVLCKRGASLPSSFCEKHKCAGTGCLREVGTEPVDLFCDHHRCGSLGCRGGCSWKTGAYCSDHGCLHYSVGRRKPCADKRVLLRPSNPRGVSWALGYGEFCKRHSCSVEGCRKEKPKGSQRCEGHICGWTVSRVSCEKPVEKIGWCTRHRCATRGCGGPRMYDNKERHRGHCTEHTCQVRNCYQGRMEEINGQYCNDDTCIWWSDEMGRCLMMRSEHSWYCYDHRCQATGCANGLDYPAECYCRDHRCVEDFCLGPRGADGDVRCAYHARKKEEEISERLLLKQREEALPVQLPSHAGEGSSGPLLGYVQPYDSVDNNPPFAVSKEASTENTVYYGNGYLDGYARALHLPEAKRQEEQKVLKQAPTSRYPELHATMETLTSAFFRVALPGPDEEEKVERITESGE